MFLSQFQTQMVTVLAPFLFCNPASKNGEPIRNPLEHLACYPMNPQRERRTVTIENQFGTASVEVRKSAMLCVPTGKFERSTTTTSPTTSSTTTTLCTTGCGGRALVPVKQIPGVPPGPICLSDIQPAPDGCVEGPDQCPTDHVHHTIIIRVGSTMEGPIPDTFTDPCGHGGVVGDQPQCGADSFPSCGG